MKVKKILEIPQEHPLLQAIKLNHLLETLHHEFKVKRVEEIIAKYNEDYPKSGDIYLHDYSDDFFKELDEICGAKYFRVLELVEPLTLGYALKHHGLYIQQINLEMVNSYTEEDFEFPHKYNDPILDAPVPALCLVTDNREYIFSTLAELMHNPHTNRYRIQDLLTGEYVMFNLGYFTEISPKWFDLNSDKKY